MGEIVYPLPAAQTTAVRQLFGLFRLQPYRHWIQVQLSVVMMLLSLPRKIHRLDWLWSGIPGPAR